MLLLLADENFPQASYKFLKEKGYDILHITDVGLASIPDQEVIEFSIEEDRVIITFDSDFGELIFKLDYKPKGVIYFRWKSFRPSEPGQYIDEVIEEGIIDFEGFVTVIDRDKVRQRKIQY
jgi:predicted nuclease of predicted toxin-antitoxin system